MKNIHIASFEVDYTDTVLNIINKNFDDPWGKNELLNSNSVKKVLIYENQIVGFLDFTKILDEVEINLIVIDKNFQNKGFGSVFIKYLQELENVKTIYLEVAENNKTAINFYKKHKFAPYGRRNSYYKNGQSAILMKKSICQYQKQTE